MYVCLLGRPVQLCQGNYVQLILLTFVCQDIDLPRCIETLNIPVFYPELLFGDVQGLVSLVLYLIFLPLIGLLASQVGLSPISFTRTGLVRGGFSVPVFVVSLLSGFVVNCFFPLKGTPALSNNLCLDGWMEYLG